MSEKSLQININSVEDAKAVIQHLGAIKTAYEAHACTSVELAIAEEVVTPTARILIGAFPWCTDYRKIVKPFDGNVLFQLPHYREPATCAQAAPPSCVNAPDRDVPAEPPAAPAPKPNRYLRNLTAPGKSAPPVQAPVAEGA